MLISWKTQVSFFLDDGFLSDFKIDGEANAILYTAVISSPSIVNWGCNIDSWYSEELEKKPDSNL